MSYFSTSLKDLYQNFPTINTLTTGCTDVIVTENEEGKLKCTAFNVRIAIPNQYVQIFVNNELKEIKAKTDAQGLCFFEAEYDKSNTNNRSKFVLSEIIEKCSPLTKLTDKINELEYSELPVEHKLFLEKMNIDVLRFEEVRRKNYFLRSRKVKPNFYSLMSNNLIQDILNSSDHLLFLSKNSDEIYYYLKNYRKQKKDLIKTECNLFSKTCINFTMQYSNCSSLRGNIPQNFSKYRILNPLNLNKLIIRIKTCQLCNKDIYMTFTLFAELDHLLYLLNSKKNERGKFRSILDKLYYKSMHLLNHYEQKNFFTSNTLTTEELSKLNLKKGENEIKYLCSYKNTKTEVSFKIYKFNYNSKIVVSDIDGTITKSDVWGNIYNYAGKDYTHDGIAKLFSLIEANGYSFIYLSSRPFSHYERTKSYLQNIKQDAFSMPIGPVFLSVSGLLNVIYTEVIKKSPHVFKISTLTDIKSIFGLKSFKAGFGNKLTDTVSYKEVAIPDNRIFTINPSGVILLNSGVSVKSGYNSLQGFVNAMFPADKEILDLQEFGDYTYWR